MRKMALDVPTTSTGKPRIRMDSKRRSERARFRQMREATPEDWAIIEASDELLERELPERVLHHLRLLEQVPNGHPIDQLHHSLQAATRAFRDGRDEPYVVCTLLHDLGDVLCPYNHAEFAVTLLRPFVTEDLLWMLKMHPLFQSHYYAAAFGRDPNARDRYRDHPCYAATVEFVECYDQCSFDPDHDTLPLEFFAPMVQRVMAQPLDRDS